jgi:chaperone modulatory protein CbpM
MSLSLRRKLEEASELCRVPQEIIIHFIEERWISPVDVEHRMLDEEDVARVQLIWELKQEFGVNDEAVPLILHLIDQLNLMHLRLK